MKKTLIISALMMGSLLIFSACGGKKTKSDEASESSEEVKTVMTAEAGAMNQLTEAEKSDGWKLLFDGETSEGWRGYRKEHFPANWKVVDGTIHCMGSGRGEAGAQDGGDILFDEQFDNFHVKLEWKISEGGNSGIFYLGQESPDYEYIWKTAPEMQVLDNINHPDASKGIDGNRQAGSLYDLISAKPQNAKPVGEWNQIEIMVKDGHVKHIQNGETVVEYDLWTEEWKQLVAGSKFPGLNENWADVAKVGYFGLQDHGDDVWYRNIRIKRL